MLHYTNSAALLETAEIRPRCSLYRIVRQMLFILAIGIPPGAALFLEMLRTHCLQTFSSCYPSYPAYSVFQLTHVEVLYKDVKP